MKQCVLFVLLSIIVFNEGKRTFEGNQVLRVIPKTTEELQFLTNQHEMNHELDFWTEPTVIGRNVDIHVKNQHVNIFRTKLNEEGIAHSVWIENVQKLVDMENQTNNDWYESYHSYDEIIGFLQDISTKYADFVSLVNIGQSYESRDLLAVKITSSKFPNPKPAIFFNSLIHAREWITGATVLYMIGQIVELYGQDDTITNLVDQLEIYVLPVTNPDGYSYTWTNDRLWRKTRSPNPGSSCIGTDPNRNFNYRWGGAGSSTNPCTETYRGSSAFSEIEVKTVGEFITNAGNFKGYIDFHSYSQLWMSPWGYTSALPNDFSVQNDVSRRAVEALNAVYGTNYRYGPISTTIYPASGSSADYTYGVSGVLYAYAVELRDTGSYGFLLPPSQILPTGQETFAALIVWAQAVLDSTKEISVK